MKCPECKEIITEVDVIYRSAVTALENDDGKFVVDKNDSPHEETVQAVECPRCCSELPHKLWHSKIEEVS